MEVTIDGGTDLAFSEVPRFFSVTLVRVLDRGFRVLRFGV